MFPAREVIAFLAGAAVTMLGTVSYFSTADKSPCAVASLQKTVHAEKAVALPGCPTDAGADEYLRQAPTGDAVVDHRHCTRPRGFFRKPAVVGHPLRGGPSPKLPDCDTVWTPGQRAASVLGLLNELKEMMIELSATDKEGVFPINATWALTHGSLIGAERCKNVLPWDGDGDVMMTRTAVSALLRKCGRLECYRGDGRYVIVQKRPGIPLALLDLTTGFYVDIFELGGELKSGSPAWYEDPWWFDRPHVDFEYDDWFPTKICEFGGRSLPCPARPDNILSTIYGKNWRTPNVPTKTDTARHEVPRL